ncbi:MAG TPA: glutathione S-transferase family protein, partial [Candidatus Binataceae bacterium]|nr:glutathione S-transferase family protein [Candidatus Binataceae bacterium]
CAKVRKVLDFKDVDYEIVEVDYLERKELLITSEQLMVPVLTLASGETIVDSARIVRRLEELYPEPTVLPPTWSGMHQVLADYIDTQLEDALFGASIPDKLAFFRRQGRDREALWRMVRDRKYGAGFVDKMISEHGVQQGRALQALLPFEQALSDRAFLLGRIGLADFALFGQLYSLAFTGELKISAELRNLRMFFARMDRISSAPEAA